MSEGFVARIVTVPVADIVTRPEVFTDTAVPDIRAYVTVPVPEPPVVDRLNVGSL